MLPYAVDFGTTLLLSVGLAMDATAVSAARGLQTPRILLRHIVLVALFFGGSQALMPLLGWFLGAMVGPLIQAWDHWIAFVLLASVGVKMLWEASKEPASRDKDTRDPFGTKVMLLLALATSIDAMAAGLTLAMLDASLLVSLVTIGVTTAILSVSGLYAGRWFGSLIGKRLDIAGGVVLIGLGGKILLEHLLAT